MKKLFAKAVVLLTTLSVLVSLWVPFNAFAAGGNSASVVFVIDDTKSMQTNDKNKLTAVAVEKYIDKLKKGEKSGNSIGIVTFSKKVLKTKDITNVDSQKKKDEVVNFVKKNVTQNGAYTNCVVGIKEAVNMLENDKNKNKAIILVTDGEYDFDSKDGSVKSQLDSANASLQKQLDKAAEKGIKIYPIKIEGKGVANDGKVDFKKIANATGGIAFTAKNAEEIDLDIDEIQRILLNIRISEPTPIHIEEDGEENVSIDIPSDVDYAVVQIDYTDDIEIRKFVYDDGERVDYTESEGTGYLNVSMSEPRSGHTTMTIYSKGEQTVTVKFIFWEKMHITAQLENPTVNTKENFSVSATVYNEGKVYDNSDKSIGVEAVVKDESGKEYTSIPLVQDEKTKEFSASGLIEKAGTYTVNVIVSGSSVSSEDMTLTIERAPISPIVWILIAIGVLLVIVAVIIILKKTIKPPPKPFGRFQVVSYSNYSTGESEAGDIWRIDNNPQIDKKTKTITVYALMRKPDLVELKDVVFSAVNNANGQPMLQVTNRSMACMVSVNGIAVSSVPTPVKRGDNLNIEISEKMVTIIAGRI